LLGNIAFRSIVGPRNKLKVPHLAK
jgi:hypothetical protein